MRELWVIEYLHSWTTDHAEWLPTGQGFRNRRFAEEVAYRETNSLRNKIRKLFRCRVDTYSCNTLYP